MLTRTIMVVDDDSAVRRIVARVLGGPSLEIFGAGDGESAVSLAAERRPDLILLDVNMPRRNGWDALRELRRRPDTRMIPVIMLTSAGRLADKVGGLELGADDYMTKPFAAPELRARVEGLLRRHNLDVTANPLTGLPGSPTLEAEVGRRLSAREAFAFFYIDVDRFKAYNDALGFAEGDRLLLALGALLRECVGDGFAGHIGGDDFVALTALEEAPYAAHRLATLFDERAAECARGLRPLPTLSIAVVTTGSRVFTSFATMASAAAEVKALLKAETARTLSRFAFDRRWG